MKVLASHRFKNDRELRILFLNRADQRKLGVAEKDTLVLSRVYDEGHSKDTHLSPDEAIVLIQLLSKAVYESVKGYEIGLKRQTKDSQEG